MAKQIQSNRSGTTNYTSARKGDKRAKKLERVISIVSGLDETRLDALILILDPPAEDDYEFSQEDNTMISERFERYEKGKTKGMPALEASKRIRAKILKKK